MSSLCLLPDVILCHIASHSIEVSRRLTCCSKALRQTVQGVYAAQRLERIPDTSSCARRSHAERCRKHYKGLCEAKVQQFKPRIARVRRIVQEMASLHKICLSRSFGSVNGSEPPLKSLQDMEQTLTKELGSVILASHACSSAAVHKHPLASWMSQTERSYMQQVSTEVYHLHQSYCRLRIHEANEVKQTKCMLT